MIEISFPAMADPPNDNLLNDNFNDNLLNDSFLDDNFRNDKSFYSDNKDVDTSFPQELSLSSRTRTTTCKERKIGKQDK